MKKKIILSVVFILSLIPMCFSQYGRLKGVQEISGIINLTNPIGFIAVILFFVGVWGNFKNINIIKIFIPGYKYINIFYYCCMQNNVIIFISNVK